ncbi:hypothetical protein Q5H93_16425 [Hymenobacter sp. ASUV-10]|uniref:Lipoprotein n=1 Tax=Hymenobacter aranciens TaxID=3063996 RepID=A0ABT9BDP3_9BACT|nr:hypothetical protein [Hymenobacter sp. ASUV-10]MDO7876332.1 hypothetical protein [Hymenobacter sp. ASUV-10]
MMNLFRTLSLGGLLAVGTAGLSGCLTAPEISTTPEISLKEIRLIHVDNPGQVIDVDTLVVVVNFKDGDGDLGLTGQDLTVAPYDDDAYKYNYFIQAYIKNELTDVFEPYTPPAGGTYNGLFNFLPLVEDRDKKAAKKGELGFKQDFTLENEFKPGTEVRFVISIMDRALHRSNEITTPSVILGN